MASEMINKALLIYQEAGRLSGEYVKMSKNSRKFDRRLLKAAAGYLTEIQYNAACIVCDLLMHPAAAGYTEQFIKGLEREYKILLRLSETRRKESKNEIAV